MHASQRSNENHNRVKVDGCGLAHVNKFLATVTCDQGIPHGDSSHDKKSDNDHYKPFEQSNGIAAAAELLQYAIGLSHCLFLLPGILFSRQEIRRRPNGP
jgi:hypothetical protein